MSLDEREAVQAGYPSSNGSASLGAPPSGGFSDPVHHHVAAETPSNGMSAGPTNNGAGRHARHSRTEPDSPVRTDVVEHPDHPDHIDHVDLDHFGNDEATALFDSHFALAGDEVDHAGEWVTDEAMGSTLLQPPPRRSAEREHRRKRRRRRMLLAIVAVICLVVAAAGWVGYRSFSPTKVADWTGSGTGQVLVDVHTGDGASAIGATLTKAGVVASVAAFTRAAGKNSRSADIEPGEYSMKLHMSGAAAVSRMLDPAAHIVAKVTIPEGTIEKDVIAKLATALNVDPAKVAAAAANIANLGLPDGYAPASGPLTSAEGFLFPDTYSFDPTSTPAAALQTMASEFTTEDRSIHFADGAKALGITPYQALIIASIAQAEVKFDTDVPKVTRVILNRLAANMPLQIDATSVYGAKVQGLDPATVQYATIVSPYNSYTHAGLPPTPIGNPGESTLKATITPVAGNWLYYVNGDAAGHLFFTNDEKAFEAAVAQCRAQNWGCG